MNQESTVQSRLGETIEKEAPAASQWYLFLPAAAVIFGSFLLTFLRLKLGAGLFPSDGGLMILALGCYLTAAVFYLTNFYASSEIALKLGKLGATLGVFLNLSSWLFRWVAGYERELEIFLVQGRNLSEMPWFVRYIPFANLYDLSLAFAFGAGITTLLVMQRKQFQIIAALSLPMAALILTLARFIGDEFIDLPPVLDSYWRPIHVGVASLSYGVTLVCFAVAVLYLIKDGLRTEWISIWTSAFAIAVFASISKFSIFAPRTFGIYTASTFWANSKISLALRAEIPIVGWIIIASAILLMAAIAANGLYLRSGTKLSKRFGRVFLAAALISQVFGIGVLIYQINNLTDLPNRFSPASYERFAVWLLQEQNVSQLEINDLSPEYLRAKTADWLKENGNLLHLSLQANPVELAALITALAGTFFASLFGFQSEKIRDSLPSAKTLDDLMYKLGGNRLRGISLAADHRSRLGK